jgi:restriction system protein
MRKNRTIKQAIAEVMRMADRPMSVSEIYQAIIDNDFYVFKAEDPIGIVRSQIRRHCEGMHFSSASPTKHFVMISSGRYWLKGVGYSQHEKSDEKPTLEEEISSENLEFLHHEYVAMFRQQVARQLKRLTPSEFEYFSMMLLKAYGFNEMTVTRKSRDGGIDGYGSLKVGLASLKVAFQSKRWKKNPVGRPDISQFRGDIQGRYEQGYFFTTSTFTSEAQNASFQTGAVPIILVDCELILDLMIEKQLGIEIDNLPLYRNALDLVVAELEDSIS